MNLLRQTLITPKKHVLENKNVFFEDSFLPLGINKTLCTIDFDEEIGDYILDSNDRRVSWLTRRKIKEKATPIEFIKTHSRKKIVVPSEYEINKAIVFLRNISNMLEPYRYPLSNVFTKEGEPHPWTSSIRLNTEDEFNDVERKVLFFIVKHRCPYLQDYTIISILHICKFDYLFTQHLFLANNYISKITMQENYESVDFPESKKSLLSPHFLAQVRFFN